MFHMDPCDKVPGSDVQDCRISAGDHSCECIYVLLQSSQGVDEARSPKVWACDDSTVARRPSSHQHSNVRHTRVGHSLKRHGRRAYIEGTLPNLGDRLSWMMYVRTCRKYRLSQGMVDTRLDDSAVCIGVHMQAPVHKVYHSSESGHRRPFVNRWTCRSVQSCHRGSE